MTGDSRSRTALCRTEFPGGLPQLVSQATTTIGTIRECRAPKAAAAPSPQVHTAYRTVRIRETRASCRGPGPAFPRILLAPVVGLPDRADRMPKGRMRFRSRPAMWPGRQAGPQPATTEDPSPMSDPDRIVIAVTGASGCAYGLRLARVVANDGIELHLLFSGAARIVMQRELAVDPPTAQAGSAAWLQFLDECLESGHCAGWNLSPLPAASGERSATVHVWGLNEFSAGIASGSFLTRGMVICPCSMGTLASVAGGASSNLIHRAADVHLKERRPLLLVPRETPLSSIQLTNLRNVSLAGATVLPAMPGFYHQPASVGDLIDFVVARICDHLRIPHTLGKRWGDPDND